MCAHEAAFQGWFFSVPAHHRDEHVVPLVRGTLCWTVTNNERKAHLPARITLDDKASAGGDAIARGGAGQGICTALHCTRRLPACLPTAAAPDPRITPAKKKAGTRGRVARCCGRLLPTTPANVTRAACSLARPAGVTWQASAGTLPTAPHQSSIPSLYIFFQGNNRHLDLADHA
jgi:hypothetical protein